MLTEFSATLPAWVTQIDRSRRAMLSERMQFAIELAGRNVAERTGGPFGAAVFDLESGELVAVGVNVVVASGLAMAHAEVMALSLAQATLGTHNLGAVSARESGTRRLQLVTSAEPCLMCLGAIHWSGVVSVAAAARDADVRAIGFDEGRKPDDWQATLEAVGIETFADCERGDAVAVLRAYAADGGPMYNAAPSPNAARNGGDG